MPRLVLSPAEAAEAFGVGERTMRRWIADGTVPAFRVGRVVRVRLEDLERLADARTGRPTRSLTPWAGIRLGPGERLGS